MDQEVMRYYTSSQKRFNGAHMLSNDQHDDKKYRKNNIEKSQEEENAINGGISYAISLNDSTMQGAKTILGGFLGTYLGYNFTEIYL